MIVSFRLNNIIIYIKHINKLNKKIMRTKILSILALLLMTAAGAWADGECGDGVTWSLSDGVLTITKSGTGTGAMADFDYDFPGRRSSYESITKVTIGDGVTTFGKNVFENATKYKH